MNRLDWEEMVRRAQNVPHSEGGPLSDRLLREIELAGYKLVKQ